MGSRQGRLAARAPFRAHKFGLVKEICMDGGDEGDQVTKAHQASRALPEAWGTQKAGAWGRWGGRWSPSNATPPSPTPGHSVL